MASEERLKEINDILSVPEKKSHIDKNISRVECTPTENSNPCILERRA